MRWTCFTEPLQTQWRPSSKKTLIGVCTEETHLSMVKEAILQWMHHTAIPTQRDDNTSQFMFLSKVLVGSFTEGHSNYRRPPPKQPWDPASDFYDSCVDNKSNSTVFVVFDTDQFYPEYMIHFCSAQPKALTRNSQDPSRNLQVLTLPLIALAQCLNRAYLPATVAAI